MGGAATLGEIGSKGREGSRSPILENAVSTSTVPERRSHAPDPQVRNLVDVVILCALEPAIWDTVHPGPAARAPKVVRGMFGARHGFD
jgi:hypothetical protein